MTPEVYETFATEAMTHEGIDALATTRSSFERIC